MLSDLDWQYNFKLKISVIEICKREWTTELFFCYSEPYFIVFVLVSCIYAEAWQCSDEDACVWKQRLQVRSRSLPCYDPWVRHFSLIALWLSLFVTQIKCPIWLPFNFFYCSLCGLKKKSLRCTFRILDPRCIESLKKNHSTVCGFVHQHHVGPVSHKMCSLSSN